MPTRDYDYRYHTCYETAELRGNLALLPIEHRTYREEGTGQEVYHYFQPGEPSEPEITHAHRDGVVRTYRLMVTPRHHMRPGDFYWRTGPLPVECFDTVESLGASGVMAQWGGHCQETVPPGTPAATPDTSVDGLAYPGWECTRPAGHSGSHCAHGQELADGRRDVLAFWPNAILRPGSFLPVATLTGTAPTPVPMPSDWTFFTSGIGEITAALGATVAPPAPVVADEAIRRATRDQARCGHYSPSHARSCTRRLGHRGTLHADIGTSGVTYATWPMEGTTPGPQPMPPMARSSARMCRAEDATESYTCTREAGHGRVHVTHSGGEPIAVWLGDEDPEPLPSPPPATLPARYVTPETEDRTVPPVDPEADLPMPIRKLSALTFGIEIECLIPSSSMASEGWEVGGYHEGYRIPSPFTGWKVQSDGSIEARYPMVAAEIVSPVLKGARGLAKAIAMVDHLKSLGARINRSCGFHVHVGWSGDAAALRRLICFVSHHEPALYAVTGTHDRETNQFCTSIKTAYRALQGLSSLREVANHHMGRYHVLNLTNLAGHERGDGGKRTVEFRVFAGTLNTVKMAAYVQLCLGMVQRALDSTNPMPWDAVLTATQQKKAARTPGTVAMTRLLAHLNWYRDSATSVPIGIFDRDTTPALMAMLRKMAKKYDGLTRTDTTERASA